MSAAQTNNSNQIQEVAMRIPTVQIKRPDGKIVTINETQLKYYIGRPGYTCDLRPKKTSGGEPQADREHPADPKPIGSDTVPGKEDVKDKEVPTTLKRKMINQPAPIKAVVVSAPAGDQLSDLNDLLID